MDPFICAHGYSTLSGLASQKKQEKGRGAKDILAAIGIKYSLVGVVFWITFSPMGIYRYLGLMASHICINQKIYAPISQRSLPIYPLPCLGILRRLTQFCYSAIELI